MTKFAQLGLVAALVLSPVALMNNASACDGKSCHHECAKGEKCSCKDCEHAKKGGKECAKHCASHEHSEAKPEQKQGT